MPECIFPAAGGGAHAVARVLPEELGPMGEPALDQGRNVRNEELWTGTFHALERRREGVTLLIVSPSHKLRELIFPILTAIGGFVGLCQRPSSC